MKIYRALFLCVTLTVIGVCSKSVFNCVDDQRYFNGEPIVIIKDGNAFIRLKYSSTNTSSIPNFGTRLMIRRDSLLVFVEQIRGTQNKKGAIQNDPITKMTQLSLVSQGRIFWECDGKVERMKVDTVKVESN